MRAEVFATMARVEDTHWWFRARRRILTRILEKARLPADAAILDAGSGTGGNLAMLSRFGRVSAMEMNAPARALADARGIVTVAEGHLPDAIPFGDAQFDLILLSDVLEHVDDDAAALKALHSRLKPGGLLLITVPAFAALWSMHDVMHHHKRRYAFKALAARVRGAGYAIAFMSYINFFLFPVIACLRLFDRVLGGRVLGSDPDGNTELAIPSPAFNRLLEELFAAEAKLFDVMRLPFGVSIVLLARKDTGGAP